MSILVLASLGDASVAESFLHLLEGASFVLGARDSIEIAPLGTYERDARGKIEIVCAVLVRELAVRSQGDTTSRAHNLESVLKTMLVASGLADTDVRVLAAASDRSARLGTAHAHPSSSNA
ncbi:MAG: hypothetical protein HY898_27890 [Deltaproteobacteria bacterium]|nr:hypothetical protein [Deltaproteobacteria bacterium]